MYPCYGDYWIVGAPPELDYDYADDDYDVYLFWPSSSQVLVPADTWYPEDVSRQIRANLLALFTRRVRRAVRACLAIGTSFGWK